MTVTMTTARMANLEYGDAVLTAEEIADGWYFCQCEWDGMLLHPSMEEAKVCCCNDKNTNTCQVCGNSYQAWSECMCGYDEPMVKERGE